MAIDRKYGRVALENTPAGMDPDEPVIVFRAQDTLLPAVVSYYRQMCDKAGSPPEHLAVLDEAMAAIEDWQLMHRTKTPDTIAR